MVYDLFNQGITTVRIKPMYKLLIIPALLTVSACGTVSNITVKEDVQPWEKDILATDAMQFPRDRMQSYLDDHVT